MLQWGTMWLHLLHEMGLWTHTVLHVVTHWPWATIAAFTAAGAAIKVARDQTRERSEALARENVVALAGTCLEWSNRAAELLGTIRRFLLAPGAPGAGVAVNKVAVEGFTKACNAAVRGFMAGRLACNDFEMQLRIAELERSVVLFAAPLPASPNETPEQQIERLKQFLSQGLPMLQEFGSRTDALQRRGFELYSPRRSLRYRFNEWRFNRRGGADSFLLPLPPLVPIPLDEALAPETDASTAAD